MRLVSKQDSTASAANAPGSMAAARASTGGNAGGALVFESKKSLAPRSRLGERSSEGSGMWWIGTQTSMEAADKLQAQRSQRRVLVEDGDEGSDDDKVRGVYWQDRVQTEDSKEVGPVCVVTCPGFDPIRFD